MKNPKLEIRNPKETRSPRPESPRSNDVLGEDSTSWTWGDEHEIGWLVLRDGSAERRSLAVADLMERTAQFGESIIRLAKRIPRGAQHPENNRLVDQLIGAGTSVGANYCEADDAVSGKDFKNKIGTCRKESKETMFFLRMIATSEEKLADEARVLWREAKELNLIFGAIWRKA